MRHINHIKIRQIGRKKNHKIRKTMLRGPRGFLGPFGAGGFGAAARRAGAGAP
jgi:hypothetical protein